MTAKNKGFICHRCGRCCRGKGGVKLDDGEVARAADILSLSVREFKKEYLLGEASPWEAGLGPEGSCRLLSADENGLALCLIQGAKPRVCRAWPFLYGLLKNESAFNFAKTSCPALGDMGSWASFLKTFQELNTVFPPRRWL